MSFINTKIDHEVPPEVREWIRAEVEAQEIRYAKIEQQMKDYAPTRAQFYQEFFDRISTIGFNTDGDDKLIIDPSDLPVKPEGHEDQVVWKYGVDSDPNASKTD